MKTRKLGFTGLNLTTIGFGTFARDITEIDALLVKREETLARV